MAWIYSATSMILSTRGMTVSRSAASRGEYPQIPLYVREVIFPIPNEELVAGILVDLTNEWQQEKEMNKLKRQAIQEVTQVVHKQMSVAQEIAGLLGETTAEIKVSLLRLLDMLEKEDGRESE